MEPHLAQRTGEEGPLRYPAEPEPRKGTAWWVAALALIVAGGAAYYYWQQSSKEAAPAPSARVEAPPAAPAPSAEPAVRHPLEVDATQPLPALNESDAAMREAVSGLIGEKPLAALFYPDRMIRRIVATIDNLPRKNAPLKLMPVKPASGAFVTARSAGDAIVSPDNARRYAPYVTIAQALDAQKMVAVYVRLYPLFQRAYEELGYPDKYFNDRVVEAIDDLLNAPELTGPVALVQRKVLYEFADPALEARSAGQKIMMRMGSENAASVKAKLRAIRQEVTRRAPQMNQP